MGWKAIAVDLNGVLTRTTSLHEEAWKRTFDHFFQGLRGRDSASIRPLDGDDYRRWLDGRARYEGARELLASRGIELPFGEPTDGAAHATVWGLANRKNAHFNKLLVERGADVYEASVRRVRAWREEGCRIGIVSASRNARRILHVADLEDLCDSLVDGVVTEELGLAPKPAPDVFVEVARRLETAPTDLVAIADDVPGVFAARAAGVGHVIAVDRRGIAYALAEAGAHRVVLDLADLPGPHQSGVSPDSARV